MTFQGKKGVLLGVLNKRSIAANCANHLLDKGARIVCSYLPDTDGTRRLKLAQAAVPSLQPTSMLQYDAASDVSVADFFSQVEDQFGTIDFLVHAISMVPVRNEVMPTTGITRNEFLNAMDISVYSMVAAARHARVLMKQGGSIVTLSYLGSQSVVRGYETLGICKAALETTVRYLAQELAPVGIRVNMVSPAPIASSSSLANPAFSRLSQAYADNAPLRRLATVDEVSNTIGFLLSNDSSGMTGETLFVDGGFHYVAATGADLTRSGNVEID